MWFMRPGKETAKSSMYDEPALGDLKRGVKIMYYRDILDIGR